jgi:hypothetical protein
MHERGVPQPGSIDESTRSGRVHQLTVLIADGVKASAVALGQLPFLAVIGAVGVAVAVRPPGDPTPAAAPAGALPQNWLRGAGRGRRPPRRPRVSPRLMACLPALGGRGGAPATAAGRLASAPRGQRRARRARRRHEGGRSTSTKSRGLAYEDVSDPEPGPQQVLVRVEAASVNPPDVAVARIVRLPSNRPRPSVRRGWRRERVGEAVTEYSPHEVLFSGLGVGSGQLCQYAISPSPGRPETTSPFVDAALSISSPPRTTGSST